MRVAKRLAGSRRVTAIVGQGPHVVQPIKRLRNKFVVFSEGNLVSNQRASTGQPAATQDGLIALLDMQATGWSVTVRRVRYAPIWVRPGDFTVLPAKPDAGAASCAPPIGARSRWRARRSGSARIPADGRRSDGPVEPLDHRAGSGVEGGHDGRRPVRPRYFFALQPCSAAGSSEAML